MLGRKGQGMGTCAMAKAAWPALLLGLALISFIFAIFAFPRV